MSSGCLFVYKSALFSLAKHCQFLLEKAHSQSSHVGPSKDTKEQKEKRLVAMYDGRKAREGKYKDM